MRRVPKLRRVGSLTAGPPFSVHVSLNRCAISSTVDVMSIRPVALDNAPYLVAFVHSSFKPRGSSLSRQFWLEKSL